MAVKARKLIVKRHCDAVVFFLKRLLGHLLKIRAGILGSVVLKKLIGVF